MSADPMDPRTDGGYELADVLVVTERQLADADKRAASALAQVVQAQRTIDALRMRVVDLQNAVEALEGLEPPDAAG